MAMIKRIDVETHDAAYALVGVKPGELSSDVARAVECAFDMGYRKPESIAEMARKMLDIPTMT